MLTYMLCAKTLYDFFLCDIDLIYLENVMI